MDGSKVQDCRIDKNSADGILQGVFTKLDDRQRKRNLWRPNGFCQVYGRLSARGFAVRFLLANFQVGTFKITDV